MIKFIEGIINWGKLSPLYDLFGKRSYAQSGEDIVAWNLLEGGHGGPPVQHGSGDHKGAPLWGFYVDIGAYHPKVFSNTYLFYKRGWRGICVEPNPEAKILFQVARPRDVFVNVGVMSEPLPLRDLPLTRFARRAGGAGRLEYFVFGEGATNTFSKKQKEENIKAGRKLLEIKIIPVKTLAMILEENVTKGQKIDLMSVDVEGMDLEVLKSNDWKKWKPRVIIVENKEAGRFLEGEGYELVGMTGYSVVYKLVE